jgi:hypothetical protein
MENLTSRNRLNSAVLWAAIFGLFVGALVVTPQVANAQNRYDLKITNNSKYVIRRIYVSSSEEENWGPDLLGEYVLKPEYEYTIEDLVPGEFDVNFVDEDGDKCILRNIKIFKNESWSLTTAWLEKCEGYR